MISVSIGAIQRGASGSRPVRFQTISPGEVARKAPGSNAKLNNKRDTVRGLGRPLDSRRNGLEADNALSAIVNVDIRHFMPL